MKAALSQKLLDLRALFEEVAERDIAPLAAEVVNSFGCSEQSFIGEAIEKFVAEDERETLRNLIGKAKTESIGLKEEFNALRAGGTTFDVELNIAVVKDEAGKQQLGMVLIAHDISVHKQRESEGLPNSLRASRKCAFKPNKPIA